VAKKRKRITAENQRAFDERTRMIEEHLALLRRKNAALRGEKVSDT
jgi:hypothetical protein